MITIPFASIDWIDPTEDGEIRIHLIQTKRPIVVAQSTYIFITNEHLTIEAEDNK